MSLVKMIKLQSQPVIEEEDIHGNMLCLDRDGTYLGCTDCDKVYGVSLEVELSVN